MRKLLVIFALLPLLAAGGGQQGMGPGPGMPASSGGGHSFSVVQTQSPSVCTFSSASYPSYTCTMTGIASGDSVIGDCTTGNNPQSFSSLLSSTPSPVALIPWNTSYGGPFIASNITSGSYALTISPGLYQGLFTCSLAEVSGVVTSSPLDVYSGLNSSSYGTGSATNETGSVTTTNANDEVCAVSSYASSALTYTPGTGYSTVVTTNLPYFECTTSTLSSTQTINPGLTWSSAGAIQMGTFALKLR